MQERPAGVREGGMREKAAEDVRVDLSGVLADAIGPMHGISQADWKTIEPELERVAEEIRDRRMQGHLEVLDLPLRTEGIPEILGAAARCRTARNFVILGIGGSALGARALYDACLPAFHNLLPDDERTAPRVFVAENIDPDTLSGLLAVAPPQESVYNVISKSGTTIETLAQFLVIWDRLTKQIGPKAADRILVTTDPEQGLLRNLARTRGFRALPIPPGVGGRFSVLTAVGLLPAAVAGLDPKQLLAGAARMDERCRSYSWKENPALALAGIHHFMDRARGKSISVMIPYSDGLRSFSEWFCQLWAESLGKRLTPFGEERSPVGQTPVRALGATDQHSQLQLYIEGPNDKLITTVAVREPRTEITIPRPEMPELVQADLDHIPGHAIGELLAIERAATEAVLTRAQRPLLVVEVPWLDADALGQLFYLYEWATIAAGMLYHINPFDQPGVEEGKRLTHAAMGKKGLESQGNQIRGQQSRVDRFRV
jgi:glucose-6-phosphate isomerase